MANRDAKDILKRGVKYWNKWRVDNPDIRPVLRELDFHSEFPCKSEIYELPSFDMADFSHADLHMSSLRNGFYNKCCFDGAKLTFADLVDGYFDSCSFRNVDMRVAKIGSAKFINCIFDEANLSYCSAEETDFTDSKFSNTKLENVRFVSSNLTNVKLSECHIYGISTWDLNLEGSVQENMIITKEDQPIITVDNIELAQFIYLLINNTKLRDVIDTITSKVVLILGNFSPNNKAVLDDIRTRLRHYNCIPIMFDFEKPLTRNFTETVYTLAHMARFVIADLTSARSIPHELATIIPRLPSVSFYPIILKGEREYGMFADFSNYHWVKPTREYRASDIDIIVKEIVDAEELKQSLSAQTGLCP